jgi:hypothetical protein
MKRLPSLPFLLLVAACAVGARPSAAQSPYPGWVEERGDLRITVGELRLLIPNARGNLLTLGGNGALVVTGGSSSGSKTVRSDDWGQSWRRQAVHFPFINSVARSDGSVLILEYNPAHVSNGNWTVTRRQSLDGGRTVQQIANGTLFLPPATFSPSAIQWIHGPITEMPNGDLLAVHMGLVQPGGTDGPWQSYLSKSTDGGVTWAYVSTIASPSTIQDPQGLLTREGWPLYYATEPSLARLQSGTLVAVMRSVNDERNGQQMNKVGTETETYDDLHSQVAGDGIFPGLLTLPGDRYYKPGPRNGPVIISFSHDDGQSWSGGEPMEQARGIIPLVDQCDEGFVAVTYGGLSGIPRWGHGIVFSDDDGQTWTDEIVFAPFLTSGNSNMAATGPNRFTVFFNVTPPQPHLNDGAWWVGAVDFTVERISN